MFGHLSGWPAHLQPCLCHWRLRKAGAPGWVDWVQAEGLVLFGMALPAKGTSGTGAWLVGLWSVALTMELQRDAPWLHLLKLFCASLHLSHTPALHMGASL